MGIVTGLVHANYEENLITRFSAKKKNRFYRPVYMYLCRHCSGTYVRQNIVVTCNLRIAISGN